MITRHPHVRRDVRREFVAMACATVVLPVAASPPQSEDEVLSRLVHTPVEVHIDELPVREAFDLFAAAIESPIIFRDDPDAGFNGDLSISIALSEPISALNALEMLLDIASLDQETTWQLHGRMLEVGTKQALSSAGQIELRSYEPGELRIDPPSGELRFADSPISTPADRFHAHPYRTAHVAVVPNATERKGEVETFAEVMRLFAGVIEPGNWSFPPSVDDLSRFAHDPNQPDSKPSNATREIETAMIRINTGANVAIGVFAPEFVHREIMGYASVRPLAPVSDQTLAERTFRAQSGGSFIRPLQLDQRRGVHPDEPRLAGMTINASPPLHREIVHRLIENRVTLHFRETPLRDAITMWANAADIPVIGRFRDDPVGHGLNPDVAITFEINNVPAVSALEIILGEGAPIAADGAWQIRHGVVEVGTKSRLLVPAARELRVYPATDIAHADRILKRDGEQITPETSLLDLVEFVVEQVEPGTWDFGQPLTKPSDHQNEPGESAFPKGAPGRRNPRVETWTPEYVPPQRVATIRVYRNCLFVNAPDYYHRLIGGYRVDNTATANLE